MMSIIVEFKYLENNNKKNGGKMDFSEIIGERIHVELVNGFSKLGTVLSANIDGVRIKTNSKDTKGRHIVLYIPLSSVLYLYRL